MTAPVRLIWVRSVLPKVNLPVIELKSAACDGSGLTARDGRFCVLKTQGIECAENRH